MQTIRITKTITAEVTFEMSEANQYYSLMHALGVPLFSKMTCPQAPKPNYPGFITWTWEEDAEVDV